MVPWRAVLPALAGPLVLAGPAAAQTIAPAFAGSYSFLDLGSAAGVATPYGGVTFKAGNPNTLLLGGAANNPTGAILQIGVTRGAGNHITGFAGGATPFSTAPNIDGGLVYGPNGVLFFTTFSNNNLG